MLWRIVLFFLWFAPAAIAGSIDRCSDRIGGPTYTIEQEERIAAWERISAIAFHELHGSPTAGKLLEAAHAFMADKGANRATHPLQPGYKLRFDLDTREFLLMGPTGHILFFSRLPEDCYGNKGAFDFFNKFRNGFRVGQPLTAKRFKGNSEWDDHFRRHGPLIYREFSTRFEDEFTREDYVMLAREFAHSSHPLSFSFRALDGDTVKLNPISREFLVIGPDEIIRTYHIVAPDEYSVDAIKKAFFRLFNSANRVPFNP